MINLLIGVTGSVATIKLPELIQKAKHTCPNVNIRVVATQNALHFIQKDQVGVEVITDDYEWAVDSENDCVAPLRFVDIEMAA